ncbi:hypothetical protein [Paenibacillus donghaensis]|uniref:Uncharacterized protein n=1 Tax=Paenibacillus donghaensis TaxID=414771 RepID=A0A2Z2KK32_9BACL|nr:hypothetical protein [Paenibacillus donghaensis]ASA26377.1 hypothetical protein B9T62_18195 [Paenibacillus donghaensis]
MDKKAQTILQKAFWTASGWKGTFGPFSGDEFDYAKSKGLMFDPLTITHDEIVDKLQVLHSRSITKEKVVTAFLHSLSTRKVHLRSALSSWALTSQLPAHAYAQPAAEQPMYSSCAPCDGRRLMSDQQYINEDLNVLNFERIRWGGIRLNNLLYCWLDLELLSREGELEVTPQDLEILEHMVEAIKLCGSKDGARQLEKRWKDIFPSNKYERDVVMEIWGYAGLLVPQDEPRQGRGGNSDFNSVANWRGEDGYSEERLQFLFKSNQ